MEPKLTLDELDITSWATEDTITLSSPSDTITLSNSGGYTYANTLISGGGYTVAPNISISAGTGVSSPWVSTSAYPYLGDGISTDRTTGGKLILEGDNADIEINGIGISERLTKIEERLNILRPNEKMEAEWDQLRELGEQYRALEAKLKEQSNMWTKLKAMPAPDIK
jgi:hypothetical protein